MAIRDCPQQAEDMLPPHFQAGHRQCGEYQSKNAETCNFDSIFGDLVSSISIRTRSRTRRVSRLKTHICPDFGPVRSFGSIRFETETVRVRPRFRSRETRTRRSTDTKGMESTSRFGTQGRRYGPRSISFEVDIDERLLDFDGRCSRDRSHRGVSGCTLSSPRGSEDGEDPRRATIVNAPFLRGRFQPDLRNRRRVDEAFADTSVRPGISIRDSPPPPVSVSLSVFETEMGDSRRRPHPLASRKSIRHRREVQAVRAREGRLGMDVSRLQERAGTRPRCWRRQWKHGRKEEGKDAVAEQNETNIHWRRGWLRTRTDGLTCVRADLLAMALMGRERLHLPA